ncbi:MAG: ABC transporter permease [Phycisphaerales bacterium]|nr:ABC transporter permease [Phycisphaerales bacterium]
MLNYIIRRLLLMIPTLFIMSFMLFAIVRFAPGLAHPGAGGTTGKLNSRQAQKEQELEIKRRLHLVDRFGHPISVPMQYWLWVRDIAEGHFGMSYQYDEPVLTLIAQRLPVTITLNLIATVIIYIIAVPGGMLAAVQRGRWFDRGFGFLTLALYSLPSIWVGSMLLGFLANPQFLDWFPAAGIHTTDTSHMTYFQYLGDYCYHIALPLVCYVYGGFAVLSKQVRAAMLDNMRQDYVRTARAKGVGNWTLTVRHIFRNSLLPLITISAGVLPGLLAGSVIVEQIFSIRGMGALAYKATFGHDLPVLQMVGLVGGIIGLLADLITDLCYAVADPRVSYE